MATLDKSAAEIAQAALKSLRSRVRLSRIALVTEEVARRYWLVAALCLIGYAVVSWNVLAGFGTFAARAILIGFLTIIFVLAVRAQRAFRWPTETDAVNRLDIGLGGRPLSSLTDELAMGRGDPEAETLWALHLERMAEKAKAARVIAPNVRLSAKDPWAFRLIALLAFVSALGFARTNGAADLLGDITSPTGEQIVAGPSFEAWAEPPAYTGAPVIYLNDLNGTQAIPIPQGSKVLMRIYGYDGLAVLKETVSGGVETSIPEPTGDVAEVEFDITQSGIVSLAPKGRDARAWGFTMIPDQAPEVTLNGKISRSVQGALQVPFRATDDYGIISGKLRISLDIANVRRQFGLALDPEPQEDLLLELPLPFNGNTREFEEILVENQAKHPWAGLPVTFNLEVTDAAENLGYLAPDAQTMPGKRFFDNLAAALADVRRELLWNRANADRAVYLIKAITWKPDGLFDDDKAYLMVRTALRRLEYNADAPLNDEILVEVADLLWNAAILIEDGDLDDARERLERAQERLNNAMEDGATQEEIEELMQELREATDQYMRMLAENAEEQDSDQANNQQGQTMTQDQLQQMMDRIQELMEQGRMEEAQELLRQYMEMMQNMRVVRNNNGQGEGEQQDGPQQQLSDTLRDQQELADETFQELQREFERNREELRRQRQAQQDNQSPEQQQPGQQQGEQQGQQQGGQQPGEQQGQQGQQGGQQGNQQGNQQQGQQGQQQGQGQQPGQGQNERGQGQGRGNLPGQNRADSGQSLAERQEALRQMTRDGRGSLPSDGSENGQAMGDAIDRAEESMEAARDRLRQGDNQGALDRQADAMDALRESLRRLSELGREGEQGGDGNQRAAGQNRPADGQALDPLGRESTGGLTGNLTPNGQLDKSRETRSREVYDEIRRRSGEQTRPEHEREYLKRLLDRFE